MISCKFDSLSDWKKLLQKGQAPHTLLKMGNQSAKTSSKSFSNVSPNELAIIESTIHKSNDIKQNDVQVSILHMVFYFFVPLLFVAEDRALASYVEINVKVLTCRLVLILS